MVYFIECGNFIKIGHTDGGLKARLRALKTANPYPLVVLATVSGDRSTETRLHQRFASTRHKGEWFHKTPELLVLINEINGARLAA